MQPNLLSISYGRKLWAADDAERARLAQWSRGVPVHHMIVFTLRSHGLVQDAVQENFTLHPTNSYFRAAMVIDAIWIALNILRASPRGTRWCISAQDPFGAGAAGYVVRWITRQPLLVQEHGDFFSGTYWRDESRAHRVWHTVGRFILRRADRVRVVSDRVRAHVRALGVKDERIVQLPVYTDIRSWRDAAPVTDLHALYPDASSIVLSVARFVPQKNLPLLLRAFARLRSTEPGVHLVLVGKGEDEWRIKNTIDTLGIESAVSILPWSDDVVSLMKTADVYALSSNYEGWARVLPEAMACGLPVVTTEVGCVGEVFLHERHGLTVPVGDEEAFARALEALVADTALRQRFAEAGPKGVEKLFDDSESYAHRWVESSNIRR